MASLSLFQTLPSLVVDLIMEYLEGRPRNHVNASSAKQSREKAVLRPLLFVNQRWRMAVLASICDSCELYFHYSRQAIEVSFPAWPGRLSLPQFRKTGLVKRVVVRANLWRDACNKQFCDVIGMPQYENLSFPAAVSLVIRPSSSCTGGDSQDLLFINDHVLAYARALLRLTPAVTSVVIESLTVCQCHPYSMLYDTLVSELMLGSAAGLCIRSKTVGSPLLMKLPSVPGLTSIIQSRNAAGTLELGLAYQNASTLKVLKICVSSKSDWLSLVYGGTEASMVYPRLASLTLFLDSCQYMVSWMTATDVAPFPVLSALRVTGVYPFGDNLLFRGNDATLVNLRLPFDAIAQNILGRFGVFERRGVTDRNSIRTNSIADFVTAYLRQDNEPVVGQYSRLMRIAAVLYFGKSALDTYISKDIEAAPSTTVLLHLNFCNLHLCVTSILKVIAALPSLVSLACVVRGGASTAEAIPASSHPSTLRAQYFSSTCQFRKLRAQKSIDASAEESAIVAMQVAVACPRFGHVNLPPALRRAFSREVAWATYTEPFKPYADSIKRLIYV